MRRAVRRLIVIVLVVELATAHLAWAQTSTSLVPSLSFGTIYDDNLFAKVKGDAGTMTLLRPALEANYESPTLTVASMFSFDMQRSNFAELSTIDARRHGNIDIKHRSTQKMTLALGARYDRTETPGELNLDTSILGERRIATRWEIVPSLAYRAAPRTTINASYNGVTETLIDDIRGVLHVARAGVTQQASTRDEVSVSYLGRRFVDAFDTHTSTAVLVGWSRELAFGTRFTLQAGPRLASDKGPDAEIVAGFTRSTNRLRIALDYWHGETIILGIRGPVAVDSTMAKLVWPTTPRTEIGFHTGVTDSTTLGDQNVRVYRAILLAAWTPRGGPYTFSGSYGTEFQHGLIRRSLFIDDRVTRQTLRLNVTIAPRLSRSFRPTGEPHVVHPQGDSP
jgi:hypothetical protein